MTDRIKRENEVVNGKLRDRYRRTLLCDWPFKPKCKAEVPADSIKAGLWVRFGFGVAYCIEHARQLRIEFRAKGNPQLLPNVVVKYERKKKAKKRPVK